MAVKIAVKIVKNGKNGPVVFDINWSSKGNMKKYIKNIIYVLCAKIQYKIESLFSTCSHHSR